MQYHKPGKTMIRRLIHLVWLSIIVTCLVAGLLCVRPAGAGDGSFAIIGDTHIGQREAPYTAFVKQVEKRGIHTIIIVGDAIETPGKKDEWDRLFHLTGDKIALHVTPGNHDANSRRALAVYKEVFSRDAYYSFSQNDTLFVLLNTEITGQEGKITGQQFAWLDRELAKPFTHKFVFLHRPLFPTIFGMGYCLDRYPQERDRLHQLFVKQGVAVVVSGHQHLYNRSEKDGVHYVISGGGGGRLHGFSEDEGAFLHYVLAKKSNGGYVFTAFDFKGIARDEFSVKR